MDIVVEKIVEVSDNDADSKKLKIFEQIYFILFLLYIINHFYINIFILHYFYIYK